MPAPRHHPPGGERAPLVMNQEEALLKVSVVKTS
jgi:hypothetical protein